MKYFLSMCSACQSYSSLRKLCVLLWLKPDPPLPLIPTVRCGCKRGCHCLCSCGWIKTLNLLQESGFPSLVPLSSSATQVSLNISGVASVGGWGPSVPVGAPGGTTRATWTLAEQRPMLRLVVDGLSCPPQGSEHPEMAAPEVIWRCAWWCHCMTSKSVLGAVRCSR